MFSRIFFLLSTLYFFAIYCDSVLEIQKGIKPESCPLLNEVPTDCVGYCLPTCDKPKRRHCTFRTCFGGCVCKEGYIRETDKGKCVPIPSCVDPAEISVNYTEPCKSNEVPTTCVLPEANCDYPEDPTVLLLWCSEGCACKEGYVRKSESDRECVLGELPQSWIHMIFSTL